MLALMVDSSDNALGAVVQQYASGYLQPLEFFAVRLTPTQKNYSTYDRDRKR